MKQYGEIKIRQVSMTKEGRKNFNGKSVVYFKQIMLQNKCFYQSNKKRKQTFLGVVKNVRFVS